ncbi:c-type cytochrome biogenesis protein CcmI [Ramlibacter sp. RBP-2]|uniref:C-type cytochrome biogenesis protein CcmI n=1 Tax=Ramlibacter lithotrophicus TaxID=2606681 RepID=A0A7X6I774_9BURK|nr:c-type cytochrome biogenesis protein CcmI [Ramlibacter lithotrophicus]NKE67196.1 c-type cytochrome biogenesis protein CcmI [Ramlibacter lithotrophicus]
MTAFIAAAAAAVAIVLVLLMRPYFGRLAPGQSSRAQLNAAIYREQFAKLEQDLGEGTLSQADYAQAKAELQRRVLEDTDVADQQSTVVGAPRKTMIGLALAVPIVAGALYLQIGTPAAMDPLATQAAGAGHGQITSPEQLEQMVAALAQKMEQEPGNSKGWAMLARSYKAIGRPADAQKAFERAGSFIDDDPEMLASYADVVASNAGTLAGKPTELIDKALRVDPNHPMSLWLKGTADFEQKKYPQAIATWERLVAMLQPGSDDARMLEGAINDARSKAGLPAGAVAAAPTGVNIKGTVELDPALKAKASPDDVVMVIARRPGTRMPLAVLRKRAAELPLQFTLDDSLSMDPSSRLSSVREIEVEARISRTGLAKQEPGDLLSQAQTVKLGADGVALRVAKVVQ